MGLGGMDTMLANRNCRMGSCSGAAVATLDHQALCLNHFLSRCYEKLENLEPRGRKFSSEPVDIASMRAFIEECSRKALDSPSPSPSPLPMTCSPPAPLLRISRFLQSLISRSNLKTHNEFTSFATLGGRRDDKIPNLRTPSIERRGLVYLQLKTTLRHSILPREVPQ